MWNKFKRFIHKWHILIKTRLHCVLVISAMSSRGNSQQFLNYEYTFTALQS